MKIDIYHGSDHIIEQPQFGEGKPYNDYGRGFYCTEHAELAKEWACAADSDGYANHYQLDYSGLSVLNLNAPEYNILNWLAILLENRKFNVADGLPQRAKTYLQENFKVDYKKYDVIIGYRADDSYFSYAGDFVNGTLSLADLAEVGINTLVAIERGKGNPSLKTLLRIAEVLGLELRLSLPE